MKILIADDHALMRSGVRLILAQIDPAIAVVEAVDGREAVDQARRERPDICLLDITMPGLNGIDALPLLLQACPGLRVLVLSMHAERSFVSEAMRAGAHGYLLKDAAVDELADALRALREGRAYLSQRVASDLLADFARQAPGQPESPRAPASPALLSPRQREVLQLIAEGRATREIAERLHLSVKTVETHRAEIMRRLDIRDIAGLTRFALRHGMVSP